MACITAEMRELRRLSIKFGLRVQERRALIADNARRFTDNRPLKKRRYFSLQSAPIFSIPPEVMMKIVKMVSGDVGSDTFLDDDQQESRSYDVWWTLFNLSKTCQPWRRLVRDTMTEMWSRIDLTHPNVAKMALTKMAGTHHPLHFRGRVHESRGDKALDRLMKSSVGRIASLSALGLTHRGLSILFRTLLADPRRSLVNLVELKLSHEWMGVEASAVVLPHLPRLQTLDLLDVTVELQAADIMNFPSLRTANFTSTWYTDDSFRGLIRILQGSPTLERLVIDYTEGAWPSGWSLDGALSGVSVPLHMLDVIIMNSVEPSAVIRICGALDMPKCSPVFGYVNDWVSCPELLKSQPNAHCHILQSFASCTCQLTIKFLKTHLNTLALILQPVVPEKDRKCRCPIFSVAFQEKPDTLDPFVKLGDAIKSVPNIQSRVMTIFLSLSDLSLISGSDAIEKEWRKLFSSLSSLKELHLLNVSLFDDSLRTLVQTFNADPMIGGELLSVNVEFQASDIATNSLLDEESLNRDGVREILWYALAANCEKLKFLELGPVPVGVCTDEEWCMQWHDILQLLLTRRQEQEQQED